MIAALAVLFSLIVPGAGHALTGNWTQAVVLGILFALGKSALLPLSLRLLRVQTLRGVLKTFYVCNWCYVALIFYAIASAFWCGLHAQHMQLGKAVLFAVMLVLVQKNTQHKFIFTALCGRSGIWELAQKIHKFSSEKARK